MATPQKIRCTVESILDHGGHVYTIGLLPDQPLPRFKAGQFLHLALDSYDPAEYWPESRVFSIASSPAEREKLLLTYSVKGNYTSRMEKELAAGREVWIKLPYGEFIIDCSRPVVLIAGGTGMTAFSAFLENLTQSDCCPVTIFYGAKHPKLLIFRAFLEEKQKICSELMVWYYAEDLESPAENEAQGQLSVETMLPRINDPQGADFYVSGPPLMLKNITLGLREFGIPSENIHVDAWE
jgi:ferredoxin-NADP reductase